MENSCFRTLVETRSGVASVAPSDTVFFIGSCFADNMSQRLRDGFVDCWANPYGTAYNPVSVGDQLLRIVENNSCKNEEIFERDNLWFSWLAHTKLSGLSKEDIQRKMDGETRKMHDIVENATLIAITFGTSWTYVHTDTRVTVANCHKMPSDKFERKRLTTDEIVEKWDYVIKRLRELNKSAHVLFTVSPIRHVKDTMHGNQVSKAILLEAVDEIVRKNIDTSYFEAYELLMDDLRDYRFYADDMIHPSPIAVDYIYDHFAEAYLSPDTRQMIREGQKITQALQHRSMGSKDEYNKFIEATSKRFELFRQKYMLSDENNSIEKAVKYLNDIKL